MAFHPKHQPHRPNSSPLLPSTLPKIWAHHAPQVGLKTLHRRILRPCVRSLPKNHGKTFSSRPKTTGGKFTTYHYSDILWAPYGPYFRQARKICFRQLFSQKSIESYEHIRKEETKNMLDELFISSGIKPVLLKDYLNALNLNIISRIVLGKKYFNKRESGFIVVSWEEFNDLVEGFFLLNNGFANIGEVIPLFNFLDLQGYIKRMKIYSVKFDRFLEYVSNEHEERRRGVENYVAI